MEMKYIGLILVAMLLAVPMVHAQANTTNTDYVTIDTVKVNGDITEDGDELFVERGDDLNIRVTIEAGDSDVNGAQIEAFIGGYKYAKYERDLVSDYTNTFDLPAGKKRSFDLQLKVPTDMEMKDAKLRIVVSDENSPNLIVYNYQLSIYGANSGNAVEIRDFFISPSETIEAGRALSFKVKVKNFGDNDLDDIKVKVSIPELDVSAYETLDTLQADESQSFEALLIRIPTDAEPGTYDVVATVEFDKYESVEETKQIKVISAKTVTPADEDQNSIITMPEAVEIIEASEGSVYPIMIQNKGTTSKTYVLSTSGISSWGTSSFEPSSVVIVKPGQSETVYLRVMANEDTKAGDKVFKVTVKSGDLTKDATVMASIKDNKKTEKPESTSLTTILEWVLIALIVVLIILGLFVVFRKGKKKDESDEEQTYY